MKPSRGDDRVISVVDVHKTYSTEAQTVTALDGVNIRVQRGELVVIVGHSGAGKSSLLGVMGALLRPSAGEVVVDGDSLWQLDEGSRAEIRACKIGFVFQNAMVFRSLSVIENVMLPTVFTSDNGNGVRDRAVELLEMVGLDGKSTSFPHELSGGEKRRVAIASALMNNPPVVLADEPTGDLDVETEMQIIDIFRQMVRGGTAVVLVTHNRDLISYADRAFEMQNGSLHELPVSEGTSVRP